MPFSAYSWARAGLGFSLALSTLAACTSESPKPVIPPPAPPAVNAEPRDYAAYTTLKWSDEFDGGALDLTKWGFDLGAGGWGNNELQTYTNAPENVTTTGSGNLMIKAIRPASNSPAYTSARILTKGKQTFVFGRIDVRAKIPKGKGIWPAIWMLGADIDQNNWPRCGEIDIMELRGSKPKELISTMHFANSGGTREFRTTTKMQAADLSDDFHIYSVVRSQDQIRMYLDGQQFFTFSKSDVGSGAYPFNNPFFVILNVAVGGDFDGNPDASTTFPQEMLVDYVRHYQYQ